MEKITLSDLIPKISFLSGGHTRADVRTILDATQPRRSKAKRKQV